jgi:hypothetical protein
LASSGSRVHRIAACALGALALGVGPCNLTKHRSDVDSDGWIDALDETIVETCIGPPQGTAPICARADVIMNGRVDERDLEAVRSYLGEVLFTPAPPPFVPTDVELGVSVLYLHAPDGREIYRWSLAAQHWLAPIWVGSDTRHIAYSAAHRRLYVAYASGAIRQIDADLPLGSTPFAALRAVPDGLEAAGPYLFASDASGIKGTHYTFGPDGAPISAAELRWYSSALAWSDDFGRMYYFRDPVSPNDLVFDTIDPANGQILGRSESPYHADVEIAGPIRVSHDGTRVLLGSGDIYEAPDLWIGASLPYEPTDAVWLENGDLLTLAATEDGDTLLRHASGDLELRNLQVYPGAPLRVFAWGGGFAVVTLVDGAVQVHPYVPTNDADGDAVANDQDAFPLDPAASLDSDGDGYADAWNPGRGPEDSTTGLQLDAFPYDSACQLTEDAPPGQPCDVAARIPAYVPARIEMDAAGIVYLLSPDNDRVYRWSAHAGGPLNPIVVGDAPQHIAYSEENGRLYVGYAGGVITQIDVTAPYPKEQPFTVVVPGDLRGLQTAGSFVFTESRSEVSSGEWQRTYAPDGTPISSNTYLAYHSTGFTWSAAQRRMYLTTDDVSPARLRWLGIDPDTGQITAPGSLPTHGYFLVQQPIRLSFGESRLLLGTGALLDAVGLSVQGGLQEPFTDAVWTAAGLVSVRPDGAGGTLVSEWTHAPALQNVAGLPGEPLRILSLEGVTLAVTLVDGQPAFHVYEPGTDADGDDVAWSADAFPFDPAASQDSDHDGYPDAWNDGRGPDDSTDGLTLDAFPQDMGCQLPQHGVAGACDSPDVLPASAAEPFCEEDALPPGPSGTHAFGQVEEYLPRTDFVPLCSGWVLLADSANEQVVVQNLVTGRSGARYALPATPSDLELDEASKRLYVALPDVPGLAAIDLITGEVQRIPAPGLVYGLALGPDGGVFVGASVDPNGAKLYWLAPGAASVTGGWNVSGQLMRWNADREELVVAGYGSGSPILVRYAFDPATGPLSLQSRSSVGNSGYELAVSPDGQHIAYSAGSNRLGGGEIADFVAGNLSSHLGIWTLGSFTTGVAFEAGGERLIAANYTSVQVFDVATHARLRMFAAPACPYSSGYVLKVGFSRGGRLALARQSCLQSGIATERYHWFATD